MKQTDEHIREIFSEKLSNFESEVPQGMWESISSQIGQSAGAGATATAVKAISAKFIAIAASVVIAGASAIGYFVTQKSETQVPVKVEISVPAATPTPESKVISTEQGKLIPTNAEVITESGSGSGSASCGGPVWTDEGKEVQSISDPIAHITPESSSSGNDSSASNGGRDQDKNANPDESNSTASDKSHEQLTGNFTAVAADRENSIYFFMASDVNAAAYHWDFGDGSTSEEMSPLHTFSEEGLQHVTLVVTDKNGFTQTKDQELEVYVPGKIGAPDIFSPNGDGKNDEFDIYALSSGIEFNRIVILDASGHTVFEGDGSKLWDGTDAFGNPSPVGVYVYSIKGKDRNQDMKEKSGRVTLER